MGAMTKVEGMTIYVGPPLPGKLQPAQSLTLNDDGALCQKFRKALLESQVAFDMIIQIGKLPPMSCQWGRAALTAGAAAWFHGQTMEAVTAYFNGIDKDEEEWAVEQLLASKLLPISLHIWHKVLQAKRPIYATFLITPASISDALIATAAPALANSSFGLLGTNQV